ncbi:MAG: hypothetical protein HGA96_18095 [Desulfobulbaceae bacterium]|nr:hypothetical protein [Desulfobulbaceae bacterium]
MEIDISKVMAYEIKKEMAERYFGFRKLIDDDKLKLAIQVRRQTMTSEQRIVMDLARIYILLKAQVLIKRFLTLTGLEEELFYDEYLVSSPTIRARVFAGMESRGLTQAGRFKNLLLDCYELLVADVAAYREKFGELLDTREFIGAEVKLFYQKNDLSSMLGFLRQLDSDHNAGLAGPVVARFGEDLESKLVIEPPEAIEHHLPVIPPLVDPVRIRGELKKLAEEALKLHPEGFALRG